MEWQQKESKGMHQALAIMALLFMGKSVVKRFNAKKFSCLNTSKDNTSFVLKYCLEKKTS